MYFGRQSRGRGCQRLAESVNGNGHLPLVGSWQVQIFGNSLWSFIPAAGVAGEATRSGMHFSPAPLRQNLVQLNRGGAWIRLEIRAVCKEKSGLSPAPLMLVRRMALACVDVPQPAAVELRPGFPQPHPSNTRKACHRGPWSTVMMADVAERRADERAAQTLDEKPQPRPSLARCVRRHSESAVSRRSNAAQRTATKQC